MRLRTLQLKNFRNYGEATISLDSDLSVFVGQNGQGKTNALEAMLLLAVGKSHRTNRDFDLLQFDSENASIQGLVEGPTSRYELQLKFLKTAGRQAFVNSRQVKKMSEYIGHLQTVLFSPEDLQLLKGSPSIRRRFLDMELGQGQSLYVHHLSQYVKVLSQRNRLLKQSPIDFTLLEVLDDQLVEHGSQILQRRFSFFERLSLYATQVYQEVSNNKERLQIGYSSSIKFNESECPLSALQINVIQDIFRNALRVVRVQDEKHGTTSVGPHRDDLCFHLNDKDAMAYASQGQQRTIALSLRLAEIELLHELTGDYPVLLLDDVLSELDDDRQKKLVCSVSKKVQTVITTTHWDAVSSYFSNPPKLFQVHSGIITDERA
jgi:DNA replication and repair protein RecF